MLDAADEYGGAGSEMFEMLGGSASQQVATSFQPASMRNVSGDKTYESFFSMKYIIGAFTHRLYTNTGCRRFREVSFLRANR